MTAIKRTDATPRVSIICRTMSRNSLHDTLRSVLNQTWPALELVLVDAANVGANALANTATGISQAGHITLNIVATGVALDRPQAANAGLAAATGQYLMFLDDDDWIAAEHVSRLVALAQSHPDCQVVYSATQKTDAEGRLFDDIIAVPFDRTVLRRDNFIPINAALFSASLRDSGCRFDETLAVYEDWDFWLQCAEQTDFMLDAFVGAFYRMGGDSETMLAEHQARYQPGHPMAEARAKLLDKWKSRWTGAQWNAVLGLVDQTPLVHSLHTDLGVAHQQLHASHQALEQAQQRLTELEVTSQHLTEEYQALQAAHIELNLAHQALDQGVREILSSFSWRVTAPYRWTRRRITDAMSGALLRHRRKQKKTPDSDSTDATDASPLQCGIVSPASDNLVFSTTLTVQAWAWSPDALQSIDLLIDGKHRQHIEPLPQHDAPEEAQRIGFARAINTDGLSAGEHVMTLVCTDSSGHRRECRRRFICQQPQALYSRWRRQQFSRPQTSRQPKTDFHLLLRVTSEPQNADAMLATLDSLLTQDLSRLPQVHWRCSIISPPSQHAALHILLASHAARDRVQLIDAPAGFTPARDSVVALLQAGELLHPDCLANVAVAWQPATRLLYTDHDHKDAAGRFSNPWFTFAWSPDLLLSQNYIGGVYFVRADLMPSLTADTPAWRYDCLLQLRTQLVPAQVTRIALVLWTEPDTDTTATQQAETEVLRARMANDNTEVVTPWPEATNIRHVLRPLPARMPRVSIIIPTTGNMRFLRPCLDTLATTDYPDIEVIILDNSRGKHPEGIAYAREAGAVIVDCDETFNWSRLNNKGVEKSSGDILLFLNDDIEIVQPGWLQELVRQVLQEDVGTVGCLLLYPNGAIQHGGVFLVDHGGGARHLFHKQLPGAGIYQQLDKCVREVSASTGACLMIRRDRFEQLGRFDEDLSIVGNDIDLCLRCLDAGLRNIWTPHSVLIHHESVSRQSKPIGRDEKTMWRRWGQRFRQGDAYYNPSLSLLREDCALATRTTLPGQPISAAATDSTQGVNLIAYIRASMGVGEAARGNASALQASGLPFGIINYERGNPSRMDNLRWQHKEIPEPRFRINLLHINADHLPVVMKDLGQSWFRERYNIGFWAWEMPEFPDQWLPSFDLLDEIWVPSTYVNQAVAAKSPVPVITIPHVIDMDMENAQRYQRDHFGIDPQAFVFISMFDTHSVAQRKNPFGSILAFQHAFAADDMTVQLVIKVNNADAANTAVLRECIGNYRNILVLEQHFDRPQIDSLINCSDCYVSLHHAEGFGLGPAEAMALGKVALLTDWSGNTEYMTADNCVPISYTLKTLGKDYGPYEAHQHWAVADIQHAAREMQDLAGNPARVAAIGKRARLTIEQAFSAQAIGERMRQRLQSIERIVDKRSKRKQA